MIDDEDGNIRVESDPLADMDIATADAMTWALRGTFFAGDAIAARFPGVARQNTHRSRISRAVMADAREQAVRLPGLRDILVVGHPVVTSMLRGLQTDRGHLPAPEQSVLDGLARIEGFAMDGDIAMIHGVPLPAGRRQTDYFMVLRYRPLFGPDAQCHIVYGRDHGEFDVADRTALRLTDPARHKDQHDMARARIRNRIRLIDYDARHVTDELQEALLLYSTAMHRDALVRSQQHDIPLYVALWIRNMGAASSLSQSCSEAALPERVTRGRGQTRRMRLLHGTAIMNEFERLFEILHSIGADHGVTRQSIGDALKGSSALCPVRPIGLASQDFADGAIVHSRALHPDMNETPGPSTANPVHNRQRDAIDNSKAYTNWTKRIRWIGETMPAAYFLGVEAQFLASVALIQMTENVERVTGKFHSNGHNRVEHERRAATTHLAAVITSNICPATARRIFPGQLSSNCSDEIWRSGFIPMLIDNPRLRDEAERLYNEIHEIGDADDLPFSDCERPRRSSPYGLATTRAKLCSAALYEHGWTQGFRFEAWLQPEAELAFLDACCRYIRYDPAKRVKREQMDAAMQQVKMKNGQAVRVTDIVTGLPRQHPVERIQDMFRSLFDRMQVLEPSSLRERLIREGKIEEDAYGRQWRAAMIHEAARLMVAVSPITLDPQLAERILYPIDRRMREIAFDGAWNS